MVFSHVTYARKLLHMLTDLPFHLRYGMAMDHVLSYEVVTASGRILSVSQDNVTDVETGMEVIADAAGTDLFKGLRGAGASFGVVTEFLYR